MIKDIAILHIVTHTKVSRIRQAIFFLNTGESNCPPRLRQINHMMHYKIFELALGEVPGAIPVNYIPSAEKFVALVVSGLGYGMLPLQQSEPCLRTGRLVDLAPGYNIPVKLYWHCWNLKSELLVTFTKQLTSRAKMLLKV